MKKTLIALLVLGSAAMAFENAVWTFEDTLGATTNIPNLTYTIKGGEATYTTVTGVTKDSQVGNYYLTQDLGKAITLSGSERIFVGGNAYWSNGNGTLALGAAGSNSFTIMAWVYFDSDTIPSEQFLFGTGNNSKNGFSFAVHNGKLDLLAKNAAHHDISSNIVIQSKEWTNIAITYDASTGTATGYINGEVAGTLTGLNASSVGFNSAGGAGAAIGSGSAEEQQSAFIGSMAEFQILSGALSQENILTAAHLTATTPTPEPTTGTLSLLALAGLCARRRRK